jgi:hypothetical protein
MKTYPGSLHVRSVFVCVGFGAAVTILPTAGAAQQCGQFMDQGVFTVGRDSNCNLCAPNAGDLAMSSLGLNVTHSDGTPYGVGTVNGVYVVASAYCTSIGSDQTLFVVTAASSDGSLAERFRNDIRTKIQGTGCLAPLPLSPAAPATQGSGGRPLAERFRNDIRTKIQSTGCLAPLPFSPAAPATQGSGGRPSRSLSQRQPHVQSKRASDGTNSFK